MAEMQYILKICVCEGIMGNVQSLVIQNNQQSPA